MPFIAANWPLFAAILVVLGLIFWSHHADLLGGFKNVGTAEAVSLINRGARVVDVRPEEEFHAGHITGAVNLPYAELESRAAAEKWSQDKPVVLVCGAGQRPAVAAKQVKRCGVAEVFNLQGGVRVWQDANLPLAKAQASSS
ncbi:MAG: rhodanese-like domain-containing protein [Pseudomonadota bacterium]|nr:rhodanese-like domain-containing protein [Pseudomonadota bacterium]